MSRKQNLGFNSTQQPTATPSAPLATDSDIFQPRAPPPSYEESQKLSSNNFQQLPKNTPVLPPPPSYNASMMGNMYGIPPNRAIQMQRTAVMYGVSPLLAAGITSVQNQSVTPKVLEFDSGARFNGKGAGSLVIPPPPPGYAPTPGQLAAMQGQPVVLQKKKKSFF